MNAKRFLGLIVLIAFSFGIINWIGRSEKPILKSIQHIQFTKISEESFALKGTVNIYNPSIFQLHFTDVLLEFALNKNQVGKIENPTSIHISSKSTVSYPFEIRFQKSTFTIAATQPIQLGISGNFSTKSWLGSIKLDIDTTINLGN